MKRYNITAEPFTTSDTDTPGKVILSRIKIEKADNGEWIRYEDLPKPKLSYFQRIAKFRF